MAAKRKKTTRKPAAKGKASARKPATKPKTAKRKTTKRKTTRRATDPGVKASAVTGESDGRLPVLKTYKLYIAGQFVRSESGRSLRVDDAQGRPIAHLCRASRKDLRMAVRTARGSLGRWQSAHAYLRGQILYRAAEMLEGRSEEFTQTLAATVAGGASRARREVQAGVDRLVSFSGWADKYSQVLGCHNPVAGPYYNFTVPEPTGLIGVVAPDEEPLLGLISLIAPLLCAGNAVVALGSEAHPLATALFAEVLATSDLPAGAASLLTGKRDELLEVLASHRDVDGIHAAGASRSERRVLELGAAENVKRVRVRATKGRDWYDLRECHSPYWIEPFVEMKTIWHPSAT